MAASMSEESLLDADLDAPLLKTNISYSSIPNSLSESVPQLAPPKKSKKRKCLICGAVIFITLLLVIAVTVVLVFIYATPDDEEDWQNQYQYRRKILLWDNNYYFGKKNDFSRVNNYLNNFELQQELHCKISNCDFARYRQEYHQSLAQYDAVIFDMDHLDSSNLKEAFQYQSSGLSLPYFIFAANNPNAGQHRNLRQERDFYNLTMSYKLNSDIVWQRWHFQYKWSQEYASPQESAIWITPYKRTPSASLVTSLERSKARLSAAVAPCRNVSKHNNLINQLKQYMDVDVHTDCEQPRWSPYQREDSCTGSFDRKYKFFLAFEEELCEDYVSENFYKALNCSIVPVVLDGADYKNFAPPYSYIDAASFNSLGELADYLYSLERNLQEYAKYFWWKNYYDLKVVSPLCDICAKVVSLIDRNNVPQPSRWHAVDSWWKDSNCTAKSKFELV